jgi:hypothetical protein
MQTHYATPCETNRKDLYVPVAEWEKLIMIWTLRSLRPSVDGFTTLSWAIQYNGSQYLVVERVDGVLPKDHFSRAFDDRDLALDYWGEMIRAATPPCTQGALPGMVELVATYQETYGYYGGYGGPNAEQSHYRCGGWP